MSVLCSPCGPVAGVPLSSPARRGGERPPTPTPRGFSAPAPGPAAGDGVGERVPAVAGLTSDPHDVLSILPALFHPLSPRFPQFFLLRPAPPNPAHVGDRRNRNRRAMRHSLHTEGKQSPTDCRDRIRRDVYRQDTRMVLAVPRQMMDDSVIRQQRTTKCRRKIADLPIGFVGVTCSG